MRSAISSSSRPRGSARYVLSVPSFLPRAASSRRLARATALVGGKFLSYAEAAARPARELVSFSEKKAFRLLAESPEALADHARARLCRCYPDGLRVDSSNFDPVDLWAAGIQVVALNYQTRDVATRLNAANFRANGGAG